MKELVTLSGASDVAYLYEPMTIESPWDNVAGNYAFASQIDLGHWHVFYVGEASSLRECLSSHDLWPKAASLGCTHVLVHVNDQGGPGPPVGGARSRRNPQAVDEPRIRSDGCQLGIATGRLWRVIR